VGDLISYLARSLLDTLADNASLTLQLKVAFDGGSETTAKTFTSQPYTVRVKATQLILLRPEPDFLVGENINIDNITDPRGLRVTVKQFQGMAVGQTLALTWVVPGGYPSSEEEKTVDALRDCEFFVARSLIEELMRNIDPAIAGFEYTVTAPGISEISPLTRVTFHTQAPPASLSVSPGIYNNVRLRGSRWNATVSMVDAVPPNRRVARYVRPDSLAHDNLRVPRPRIGRRGRHDRDRRGCQR
jgi:hypothetical protein